MVSIGYFAIMLLVAGFFANLLISSRRGKRYSSFDKYPVYEGDDLELVYTPACSVFTLWTPTAGKVRLKVYDVPVGGKPAHCFRMKRFRDGAWKVTVKGDLKGCYYTFQIKFKGCWLEETPGIWAKAVGVNGDRAAVVDWNDTHPEGWADDTYVPLDNFNDMVIYEIHHRDFSVASGSGIRYKGKFLALTEEGTRSMQGEATGIDHLKELGITHVHLLPSFDFASIDEVAPGDNCYNWGYDPKNYNVPEGSYSTDPFDPVTRIREFKQLVMSLHKNNIRVILDVVYNHTYISDISSFDLTAPEYFYRQDAHGNYSNASGCGNETASERPMVRRFIIESVKFWATEYHIDGFRFDLMGIHDIETMNAVKAALEEVDPTIFVYGEGWTAAGSPYPEEKRAVKANAASLKGVAVFNDDLRDGLKGHFSDAKMRGFVSGAPGMEETIKFGVAGAIEHPQIDYSRLLYSKKPYVTRLSQIINYVSCHDDLCLGDKLKLSSSLDMKEEELLRFDKLAQTVIFTSQGVPFLYAGEEMFRTKKGISNSFNCPDSINEIDWSFKSAYKNLFTYYKNLIELRKDHPAFRMTTASEVREALHFLDTRHPNVVAYTLNNHANGDRWQDILVIYNGNRFDIVQDIPEKKWNVVCRDGEIDLLGIITSRGGSIRVMASSALIAWHLP